MESNIYSQQSDLDLREFLIAVIAVEIFMLVFLFQCKVYDLATATFFAYGLGLMARGKLFHYLVVFALANLNRETTLLLTVVFMVHGFSRLGWSRYVLFTIYQVLIFGTIRLFITHLFASSPGSLMLVRPLENLALFLSSPISNLIHWSVFGLVSWLCIRRWKFAPGLLRVALVVLMPTLFILYLILGWAFEIRVFAEVYPVIAAIVCRRL